MDVVKVTSSKFKMENFYYEYPPHIQTNVNLYEYNYLEGPNRGESVEEDIKKRLTR